MSLFFAWCVVSLLPDPARFRFFRGARILAWRYSRFYENCKKTVAAWHLAELKRLSPLFDLTLQVLGYADAEIVAEANGIKPFDSNYPDMSRFGSINWKEEATVHADVLATYRKTGRERMKRLEEAVKLMDDYPQERVDAVTKACVSALKKK